MKKLFFVCAVAALALTVTACGNRTNNNAATETETATETTAAPAAAAEESVLDKYEALVNQAIELQGKVAAGDVAAAQEYGKVAEEMQKIVGDLQTAVANMTEADQARFAELAQKLAAAAQASVAQ